MRGFALPLIPLFSNENTQITSIEVLTFEQKYGMLFIEQIVPQVTGKEPGI